MKEEQARNMRYMLVTFEVSKFERSRVVRPEQPSNMLDMFVTFEVLRFDTSREVRALQ